MCQFTQDGTRCLFLTEHLKRFCMKNFLLLDENNNHKEFSPDLSVIVVSDKQPEYAHLQLLKKPVK